MKINKFIYTAVIGALFASCQSVETPMFSDKDAFVAFDNKTTSIDENANKEIQIPVSLVASKSMDVTVTFAIDTMAYANKNAAEEGVNFVLKNTTDTLTFSSTGELVQYITIEPIDNGDYTGDLCFDIKLSSPSGCNLGANYTIAVTIADDDHPLAAAGILGTYSAVGQSPFSNLPGPFYWTCQVSKDADYVNRVWFSQIAPEVSGLTQSAVMGTISDDYTTITISSGQSLGTVSSYNFVLDIVDPSSWNPKSSTIATVNPGVSITVSDILAVSDGEGYYAGAYSIVMTKVQE